MTIDTQKLRDLIRRASPLPWTLATSNSWRRIVDRYGDAVCTPCTQQTDGHPDLAFPGGIEGPTAQLLIEAVNSLPGLLDARDAQAAEIAEAKGQIERLDQQNNARRLALNALGAENARLRHALRWASAALQEACRRPTIITEKDRWRIGDETRTTGEILAAADAALSGESND